jgi:hypothetical protein
MADYQLDAEPRELLTEGIGNPKVAKGRNSKYLTAIMHLAPEKVSGRNVCPHATRGCANACLNTAGQGGMALDENGFNRVQVARIRRTRLFHRDRAAFMERLAVEIAKHEKRAKRKGLIPAVRLNGTSDLPWEAFPVGGFRNLMAMFPDVVFYDYTKWPIRLRKRHLAPNYHLTFSLAEDNDKHALDALAAGVSVAVVFDRNSDYRVMEALPDTYLGVPVVDGDKDDLRFLDPKGVVVGLRAKGRAKRDRSGFVRKA